MFDLALASLTSYRTFLGLTEAGLYPGIVYYVTMWYCPDDLGLVCAKDKVLIC